MVSEVSNASFNDIWSKLRSIVEVIERSELSGTSFVQNIDELLNADLDPDKSSEYSNELERMELEEHETRKMIQLMESMNLCCSSISHCVHIFMKIPINNAEFCTVMYECIILNDI